MKTNPNDTVTPSVLLSQGGNENADQHLDLRTKVIGGITIRAQFASMFIQGMLSSDESFPNIDVNRYVSTSLQLADKLIDELNHDH